MTSFDFGRPASRGTQRPARGSCRRSLTANCRWFRRTCGAVSRRLATAA